MPAAPPDRSPLEVADILRGEAGAFRREYGQRLSIQQQRVVHDLQVCRTAALGGHVRACTTCAHHQIAYNSCRNRHCPKCQAAARSAWLAARASELLPIPYFHVVFTLPPEIAALALQNKRLVYGLLFEAASSTLLSLAANPRHLGAKIGLVAVLHTWGQNLLHHPHLHCVVSGGGLSPNDSCWIASRDYYFLPVKLLSYVYRQKFRTLLQKAFARGELKFFGELAPLAERAAFETFLAAATRRPWVVYAKPPFGGPEQVLKYLARYTHRVAISNRRLLAYQKGQVTFRYKDYARGSQQRTMTLAAGEFIRRFLLHVLPTGFMRIRHYGYLANRHRQEKLAICRGLLGSPATAAFEPPALEPAGENTEPSEQQATATFPCPACKTGRLEIIETLARPPRRRFLSTPASSPAAQILREDSS